jgi:hypothetical protein
MGLSFEAQILLIGLWTEADDQGVFEWKPVTLRARLRPTKDGCVENVLAELVQARCICGFEHGGRQFGAIRNFCRYQRPRKPSNRFVVPPELRTWVGLAPAGTEAGGDKGDPVLQTSEPGPPMEGKEGEEGEGEGGKSETQNSKELPNKSNDDRDSVADPDENLGQKALYAFVSGVIKLNEQDLDQWRKAFPNLSLEAELLALSEWAALRPNWFSAVSAALAKKQRAAVLALERVKAEAKANGRPPPRDPNDLWDHAL